MSEQKIKLRMERERLRKHLTVNDLIALEEQKLSGVRSVIATFLVDENDQYVSKEKALKIAGSLSLEELFDIIPKLREAVELAVGGGPLSEKASTTSTDTPSTLEPPAG